MKNTKAPTKAGFSNVMKYAASSVYTTVKNLFKYEDDKLSEEDKLELERVFSAEKAFKARLAKKGLSGKYKDNSDRKLDRDANEKPVKKVEEKVR